jgi:glutamine amidotransferase
MCELFGLSCNEKDRAVISLPLFSRYSEKNWHGWGVAYYKGNKAKIEKQAKRAAISEKFWRTTENAISNIVIAHLRLASNGKACDRNCHPFRYQYLERDWIFAHNGTLNIDYESRVGSDIDSTRAFTFIIDKIAEYRKSGVIKGLYPAVVHATKKLLESYDGTLNYLLSDGQILYAFCNHRRMHYLRREKDYGGAILISTQRLTHERWINIPKNRLFLVSKGEIIVLSDPIF